MRELSCFNIQKRNNMYGHTFKTVHFNKTLYRSNYFIKASNTYVEKLSENHCRHHYVPVT